MLGPHRCDFSWLLPIARDLREQIDWARVADETDDSPYARAFLVLVEELSVDEVEGSHMTDESRSTWRAHVRGRSRRTRERPSSACASTCAVTTCISPARSPASTARRAGGGRARGRAGTGGAQRRTRAAAGEPEGGRSCGDPGRGRRRHTPRRGRAWARCARTREPAGARGRPAAGRRPDPARHGRRGARGRRRVRATCRCRWSRCSATTTTTATSRRRSRRAARTAASACWRVTTFTLGCERPLARHRRCEGLRRRVRGQMRRATFGEPEMKAFVGTRCDIARDRLRDRPVRTGHRRARSR